VISNAALPLLKQGLMRWSPALGPEAEALRERLAREDPEALSAAVEREGRRRLDAFLTGVERYRRHPYRRGVEDPPAVWSSGTTSLRDFGSGDGGSAAPLLLVPSLINRGYILDLSARRSFARWLAARGFRPFLLDWGAPAAEERTFGLTEYVTRRLEPALDAVADLAGAKPLLLGYCMGGLLAVALAQRRAAMLRGLALLATPWDFHAGRPAQAAGLAAVAAGAEWLMRAAGELPVDVIQALFASLDPVLAERKFSAFAALDPDSDAARDFVALGTG
jgi:polyhydroxyalkanoate synthase